MSHNLGYFRITIISEINREMSYLKRKIEMDKCYYGSLKDRMELRKSSSGGFAASIAKYAIQKQGIVYGVAYTSDFKAAEFIRATTEKDIQRLLGSKYICR